MALSDKQIKKVIADYVEMGSYNAVGKKHGISPTTVKKYVKNDHEIAKKCEEKNRQNTEDILGHMEKKRDTVCQIIDVYLAALLDPVRIEKATPSQLTTALGTLIDKFTMASQPRPEIHPLVRDIFEAKRERDK